MDAAHAGDLIAVATKGTSGGWWIVIGFGVFALIIAAWFATARFR